MEWPEHFIKKMLNGLKSNEVNILHIPSPLRMYQVEQSTTW